MPATPQNRRRPRFREWLTRAWRSLHLGWDFYLFVSGYLLIFGLFGVAVLLLPPGGAATLPESSEIGEGTPPDSHHWFGTDAEGNDLIAPVLRAAGISVWLSLSATVIAAVIGSLLGTVLFVLLRGRGYRLLRMAGSLIMSLPAFFVLLVLAAGYGAGTATTLMLLAGLAGTFIAGRSADWFHDFESRGDVIAARALGFPRWRLLGEHLLFGLWPRLAATSASLLPGLFLAEVCLGFSGAGAGVSGAEGRLGVLLAAGRDAMFDLPWLMMIPGAVASVVAVLLGGLAWAVRRTLGEPVDDRLI